ncbi:Integral membrane protein SED5 [Coemansia erecta]|uniref:Integral membrane protein SED5 n=1 Tax=Coemansia asiatica TaxID=1052880 RepID=A0A9W7XL02_9FUNG|nr:Integral membrane protein SED5 [Coemansia asiatica]KAJ2847977.1 Integral membrane protein SED5 [Coemansia erecta]KAJ2888863.1 Integral membrane protein SED5 [Coemansia asiatica]
MATRSRTFLFIQYRNSFGHVQRRKHGSRYPDQQGVGDSGQRPLAEEEGLMERTNDDGEMVIELSHLPPRWVDLVDDFNEQLEDVSRKIKRLEGMHKKHLLPGFDDRTEEERKINALTQDITTQFQKCGELVRSIGQYQAFGQEQVVGKNIQSSLALRLQERSAAFRTSQSTYLHKMSLHKDVNTDVFALDTEQERLALRKFDMTLTDEQLLMVESNEAEIAKREGELANIHQSIVELAAIFGQMQEMIVDQGTMLDRIDYNVENTVINVASAAEELVKADKHHKGATANKCIVALGVVVIVLVVILLLKWL